MRAALFLMALLLASPVRGQAPTAPVPAGGAAAGALEETDQAASDGTLYDDWTYSGKRGEKLTITLRSSDFDCYVRFGRLSEGRFSYITAADDGAGGTDSRLVVTLPADGEYVVRVNTLFPGEAGAYTLQLDSNRS